MDFSFDDTQKDVQALAAQIFARATPERIREVEASPEGVDRDLWRDLAHTDLLGVALPISVGGSGHGLMELCVLAQEMGRRVAPVPLLPTVAFTAYPLSLLGVAPPGLLEDVVRGKSFLTADLEGGVGIPIAPLADHLLLVRDGHLALLASKEATIEPTRSTHRELQGNLVAGEERAAVVARGEDAVRVVFRVATATVCATAVGVVEEALRLTASYISERKQFGRPIATFQAATMLAADAYIDAEAIRATTWSAIWRLSEGRSCDDELAIAKFWVAEGGQRIVHACQHLHGGIGVDVDYPIHRYFLWSKELELRLGGATEQLLRIGASLAEDD